MCARQWSIDRRVRENCRRSGARSNGWCHILLALEAIEDSKNFYSNATIGIEMQYGCPYEDGDVVMLNACCDELLVPHEQDRDDGHKPMHSHQTPERRRISLELRRWVHGLP